MKRLLPDTLFGRLFVMVLAAIMVSHLMTFTLLLLIYGERDHRGPPFAMPRHEWQAPPDAEHPHPPPGSVIIAGHAIRRPPLNFWIGIASQLLALSVAAWFGARMLARPMQRLAHAASKLGARLDQPAIEESGSSEERQAARNFNRMQERIRQSVEERGRFLAAVSHDLRSPLTRMKLRLQRLSSEGAQQKFEDDIDEMAAMLNATLDYLRGDAAQDAPQLVDVQALIEAMAEDAREAGEDVTVSGAIAPMPAYPLALRRCLSNLIGNALRYGERAEITLCDADGQARIDIRDFGPGIPEDKMALVFEPFVRLESSRNKATGGVGLGLAIARAAALTICTI
jgi:protein-histidine pros-kinase